MKTSLIAIALCTAFASSVAFATDRPQTMAVSQTEFRSSAERDFAEYIQQMKADNYYLEPTERAQVIFDRIKAQTLKSHPESKNWNWLFCGDLALSFKAMGGVYGKVILGPHLFEKELFNDDELAFVIAHEVVHSIRDHAREKFKKNNSKQFIELSHAIEYEADELAIDLIKQSGFNPQRSLGYLLKMRNFYNVFNVKQNDQKSLHPNVGNRYDRLLAMIKN